MQTLTAQYKTCPTFQGKPLSQSIRGTGGWQQMKTVCLSRFASWCWYVRKSSRAFPQPFQTYLCPGVSILEGVSHTNLQHFEHPNNTVTDIWFESMAETEDHNITWLWWRSVIFLTSHLSGTEAVPLVGFMHLAFTCRPADSWLMLVIQVSVVASLVTCVMSVKHY